MHWILMAHCAPMFERVYNNLLVFEKGILVEHINIQVDWIGHATWTHAFRRSFAPSLEGTTILNINVNNVKERECSLARGHGEIVASKKEVMCALAKWSFEIETTFVHEVKELVDLKLRATSVHALVMNENKTTTQANIVSMQSKVLVVKCI